MNSTAPVLTPTTRALTWCLHLLVVGLLALAAVRAVADSRPHAGAVVAAAAVCGLVYAAGPLLPRTSRSRRAAAVWLGAVGAVWLVLLSLSADGVWLAFPLYFLQLHLLPRRTGLAAVAVTAVAAIAGYAAHQGTFGPAMVIGPALGAAVAIAVVWGYQALYRESEQRRRLIEELTATRADLAAAEHTAGVLAERERLAREIHDTLAQGLTSIQLLLRAAERALPGTPENAARYVGQAREAAADNLAEARRFVAALTPPSLEGATLGDALARLCATLTARDRLTAADGLTDDDGLTATDGFTARDRLTAADRLTDHDGLTVRFHVTGAAVPLPTAYDVALLRIAQSALANTVRHAGATTADVTLGYRGDHVTVDVVDDGRGFDPDLLPAPDPERGGFGLATMRARLLALGGTLTVASAPGHGTALAARLPLSAAGPAPDDAPHHAPDTDDAPEAHP